MALSHAKCAYSPNSTTKQPRLANCDSDGGFTKARSCDDFLLRMSSLTPEEQQHVKSVETSFFRNGINVRDSKHAAHSWRFYFVPIEHHALRDDLEVRWRELHGQPALCSYARGR